MDKNQIMFEALYAPAFISKYAELGHTINSPLELVNLIKIAAHLKASNVQTPLDKQAAQVGSGLINLLVRNPYVQYALS